MDKIIVLDMGGQYCHLLARRIRDFNVYSEILPPDTNIEDLKKAKGIILSGGPSSVYDKNSPKINPEIFSLNIPILGLCYGHQLMAQELGGTIKAGTTKEYGISKLKIKEDANIFTNLTEEQTVWMSHGDVIEKLPDGFDIIASTDDCKTAAIYNPDKNYYGFQFHPEVTHTPNGSQMLKNFVINVCKSKQDWTIKGFLDKKIEEIKEKVDGKNVFLLVSGGVDSTVCFALLEKAIGKERVYGFHINNGFMRKNETRTVKKALTQLGFNLRSVDATNEFLASVAGIYDPEEKRKIIGEKFIEVQEKAVKKLNLDPKKWLLGQGTIYPDTIESKGTEHADLIKTHHNRVEAVQKLIEEGKVIEPISELYKDEVRKLGLELGLPTSIVMRMPFPGPGLAIRCLCSEKGDKIENEEEINKRITEIASKYNLKGRVLPLRSVGIQGDARTYKHPVMLYGRSNWEKLEKVSTELTNNIPEINRVVYLLHFTDFEGTIKNFTITRSRLDFLREVESIAMEKLDDKSKKEIWQFPIVLLPYGIKGESVVLRPVYSQEAMTAEFAKINVRTLKKITKALLEIYGLDAVFYDITNKPPGTIEWE